MNEHELDEMLKLDEVKDMESINKQLKKEDAKKDYFKCFACCGMFKFSDSGWISWNITSCQKNVLQSFK